MASTERSPPLLNHTDTNTLGRAGALHGFRGYQDGSRRPHSPIGLCLGTHWFQFKSLPSIMYPTLDCHWARWKGGMGFGTRLFPHPSFSDRHTLFFQTGKTFWIWSRCSPEDLFHFERRFSGRGLIWFKKYRITHLYYHLHCHRVTRVEVWNQSERLVPRQCGDGSFPSSSPHISFLLKRAHPPSRVDGRPTGAPGPRGTLEPAAQAGGGRPIRQRDEPSRRVHPSRNSDNALRLRFVLGHCREECLIFLIWWNFKRNNWFKNIFKCFLVREILWDQKNVLSLLGVYFWAHFGWFGGKVLIGVLMGVVGPASSLPSALAIFEPKNASKRYAFVLGNEIIVKYACSKFKFS